MSNCTSSERRSAEIWPAACARRFVTCGIVRRAPATSATTALKAGASAVSVFDWTSTLSDAGVLKPALDRIACARAVSPVPCSESVSLTVPAALPRTTATTTNPIHRNVAVFQWPALQRPERAARFCRFSIVSPPEPSPTDGRLPLCLPPGGRRHPESPGTGPEWLRGGDGPVTAAGGAHDGLLWDLDVERRARAA